MYWPVSTPRIFSLSQPVIASKISSETSTPESANGVANEPIVAIKLTRTGVLLGVITSNALHVFQNRPMCPVAVVVRSAHSIQTYGKNVNLLIRPDNQVFVVQTSSNYFLTYVLHASPTENERVAKFSFNTTAGIPYVLPGPGEELGVLGHNLRFRMVIKVDAGIESAVALEDELVVLTTTPPAAQLIRWTPDAKGGPQTRTELLSHLEWFNLRETITTVVWEHAMGIYGWISSGGKGWAVIKHSQAIPLSPNPDRQPQKIKLFSGNCFHNPQHLGNHLSPIDRRKSVDESEVVCSIAINSRFSLISVGTYGGSIHIYNVKDYAGHIPLLKTINRPYLSFGRPTVLTWSPDGYSLFAGYEGGWAMFSVFGKPVADSVLSEDVNVPNEEWLAGIINAVWLPSGNEILLVPSSGHNIWSLELARWSLTGSYNWDNLARTLLVTNEKLLLYRGHDQSDLTTISHEAILWQEIAIPYSYLSQNWPIYHACLSGDGRYIAIAGKKGLGHYSIYTGRWKFFVNEHMESEFFIHGGMIWFENNLIAAVDTDRGTHEIRLYSRERELDSAFVLHVQQISSSIILMSLVGDSLLVYTYNNTLYQFVIYSNTFQVGLELVGQISFSGIVHAPARVRAINWILPVDQAKNGNPIDDISCATIVFLIDGKLVMLYRLTNEDEVNYEMKVLLQNVEFFSIVNVGILKNSIWGFDGSDVVIWLSSMLKFHSKSDSIPEPIRISVEFYPLSFLFAKGIIIGLESNLVHRRNVTFTYSSQTTRTHLFIHHILRYYLTQNQEDEALKIADSYKHLEYFGHALEVMLHDVLDEEADHPPAPEQAILPRVIKFLNNFPEILDVIVGCTRKTEVASWNTLFNIVGSPKDLFEKCMSQGRLKTAGGYLLILHTMEQLEDSSQDMIRLFSAAVESQDWDLCKELARFLVALDSSGNTLREALKHVKILVNRWNGAEPLDFNKQFIIAASTFANEGG
ncbi:RIC1-domain-containing protein [Lipomyces japonicus]|uniref:RIC1-domain-containing protein n=1 Tax=Lipomyces japonicus TaxID=56871 RepID=UPI0034CE21D5